MTKKKKARELSTDEMQEAGVEWGEELYHDLNRGTQTLDEEDQEIVEKARDALMRVLDLLTSSVPPEPTEEHLEYVHSMCKHAVYFRNCIRRCYLASEGYEMPEKWERIEGSVH